MLAPMVWGITSKRVLHISCALASLFTGLCQCPATPLTNVVLVSSTNTLPRLTAGAVTNGQIRLSLQCQIGTRCVIESSPDLANWTPVATNNDYTSSRLVTLPAPADVSFYRAARDPMPLFAYALAARGYIDLKGLGTMTDSWNSHDPNQSNNGFYNGYFGTNGDMASMNGFVSIGNKTIVGDLYLGSSGPVIIASGGNVTGQIYTDSDIYFPDVSLPTRDTNGNAIVWVPAPGNSSAHAITNSGYYIISDSGTISVEPGAVVALDIKQASFNLSSMTIKGGTTNAATLVIYQESGSASLGETTIGGAGNSRPENCVYFGLPGVTQIVIASSSTFVGAIYAPEAAVTFSGGSGGANNFIGSCIGNTITVNSNFQFHFDESLLIFGPFY